jgi:hypothetical protein
MTQPITLQVLTAPGHTEVRVGGEIDLLTAPRLRAHVARAIDKGPTPADC